MIQTPACYCVEHLCWSWKDGDIHSYGAPHFYTLTNITVQLVIALAEHLTNGQRLQIMEAGGSSAECISKRHEWIGIKPGTGLRFSGTSEGWNNTDSDIHTEGTNRVCSLCQKELCTKGPNLPSSRKCSHLRSRILPYRTIAHGANALTCFNLYPRTSWNSKEAEFRQRSCALLHFSGRTYCSNNGSFKLKLPRH